MQEQLLQQYQDLTYQLSELPEEIRAAHQDLTESQTELSIINRRLEEREAVLMGGVEGKNAELRKAHLVQLKVEDSGYSIDAENQAALSNEIAKLRDDIDYLERSYGAVCYQSKLLAAMLTYLGSAGAPVKLDEVKFMSYPEKAERLYANEVTIADAEALGL